MRVLDTNVCIDILRGKRVVIDRLRKLRPEEYVVSAVTEFELVQGCLRAPKEHQETERKKVSVFLQAMKVAPFDSRCGQRAGEINAALLTKGTPISIADVFIAALALSYGWVVVTNNTKDFRRIPSLKLEDWR
jgi:tRNA(fMet)-specific endonuclease VapC